jgi:curli biogenesis system outer membrane secretion channel CsgG
MRIAIVLAGLLWGAAASAQSPVLAVIKFQDESGALPFQGGAGRVLTNMLTTELAARPGFTVVERQKLRDVLEEQALSESGRLSEGDNAKLGQLLGADFLVTGTVTAFEENVETKYSGGGFFRRGKVEAVSQGGYLAVDLRVIDARDGRIAYARTVEGYTEAKVKSFTLEGGSFGQIGNGPDARATRAAVIEIIDFLECAVVTRAQACLDEYAARDARRIEATRKAATVR